MNQLITLLFLAGILSSHMDNISENNIVSDRDGNEYQTVKIGQQEWMAENLRVCSCTDSTKIQEMKIGVSNDEIPGIYWYDNDPASENSTLYGGLYNWITIKKCDVCPIGWHLPSEKDWFTLIRNWMSEFSLEDQKMAVHLRYAAYHLRETGDALWVDNEKATNSTGFSARPGGWLKRGVWYPQFIGERGAWWTTSIIDNTPVMAKVARGDDGAWTAEYSFGDAVSIRCFKDSN